MLSRIPSSSFSTVRATVDQHSSHLPPRDGLCTGCPVTSRRSCLSSNFGLIARHLPASVSHNDRRKVQTFVTLYSTPYAGYYAGPWSMSTIKSQPMVSARLSASATKKPVVCRPMAILYPPSMLFFFSFSPRQSTPPRLYPLARIRSTPT